MPEDVSTTRHPSSAKVAVTAELLARHDRPGPRYTSYPTALEFDDSYGSEAHRALLGEAATSRNPLSLYVHLPFCRARCSFCACHVVITKGDSLPERYLAALSEEAATVSTLLGDRRGLIQYHWGGGTPTFHSPDVLVGLHHRLLDHFELDPAAELSVEVDPRVTGRQHLAALREMGFNRLSVGVQDMDEGVQDLIGRHQTREQTERLVSNARSLGFRSINLDLVYGLPGQTATTLTANLDSVIALRPDRLAVYSFAYVPWMRPHQRRIDPSILPTPEQKFSLLALLVGRLTSDGYAHIGMDHFALSGDDLAVASLEGRLTRNFMGYSTTPGTDVVALGTSGISDIDGVYAQNHRRLADYLRSAASGELTIERGRVPSRDDRIRRHVITRLMCGSRVELAELDDRFDIDARSYFASELEALTAPGGLVDEGLASVDGGVVEATPLGRFFIRRLAMTFDAYLPEYASDQPRFSRTI